MSWISASPSAVPPHIFYNLFCLLNLSSCSHPHPQVEDADIVQICDKKVTKMLFINANHNTVAPHNLSACLIISSNIICICTDRHDNLYLLITKINVSSLIRSVILMINSDGNEISRVPTWSCPTAFQLRLTSFIVKQSRHKYRHSHIPKDNHLHSSSYAHNIST